MPNADAMKAEGNAVRTQCHSPAGNPSFPMLKRAEYDVPAHHLREDRSEVALCRTFHMPEQVWMGIDVRRRPGSDHCRGGAGGKPGIRETEATCLRTEAGRGAVIGT